MEDALVVEASPRWIEFTRPLLGVAFLPPFGARDVRIDATTVTVTTGLLK